MKKVLMVVLATLFVFTLAGAASAQYKATMKLASVTPPDHFYNVGARKFADLINERTNGRIEIKNIPWSAWQRRTGDHRARPAGRGRDADHLHRADGRVQSVH